MPVLRSSLTTAEQVPLKTSTFLVFRLFAWFCFGLSLFWFFKEMLIFTYENKPHQECNGRLKLCSLGNQSWEGLLKLESAGWQHIRTGVDLS